MKALHFVVKCAISMMVEYFGALLLIIWGSAP